MQLFYSTTSPFVRKVLVAAHELGVVDRIETKFLRPMPTAPDAVLSQANPLSKIPALVLDDGSALFDSPVICEYLETLSDKRLVPASGMQRFSVLRTQALSDGILDATILVFYERLLRPKELHWDAWLAGQTQKATQGLDLLEREAAGFGSEIDLGQICVATMLGWLEFRSALGDIRASRPQLFAWYDRLRQRPSMQATEPHA